MGKAAERQPSDLGARADGFDLRTEEGFERFVRKTGPWLRGYLAHRRVPFEDIDDLLQDTLPTVWTNRARVQPGKEVAFSWFVMKRLCKAHLRKTSLHSSALHEMAAWLAVRDRTILWNGSEQSGKIPRKWSSALESALGALSRRQRQVINLVWRSGYPRRQAARRLGISEATLRVQEARARRKFRGLVQR